MNTKIKRYIIIPAFIMCLSPFSVKQAMGDEQELFTSGSSVQPNVLLILDNSQSMDEDFVGNSICAWQTNSRLVEGKRNLRNIVNTYASQMRIGLMSYKQENVSSYHLHNAAYFVSYEPKSYCPSPPAECQDYCINETPASLSKCQSDCYDQNSSFDATYRDEIITNSSAGSPKRTNYCKLIYPKSNYHEMPDSNSTIYYKLPGTYYAGSDKSYRFNYSVGTSYSTDENPGNDSYKVYGKKTGMSDGHNDYSDLKSTSSYGATDEDTALGFADWGRRWAWYYSGRVWFSNSSPGGGYLDVACDTGTTSHVNSLLDKLDMKEGNQTNYMTCNQTGNSCGHVVAAGLTPTAGTFQSAINYFKGVNPSNGTPITDSCQKSFVVYVTDGLPSVNESGGKASAATLMPAVLGKIDSLRALQKDLGSGVNAGTYTFNIKTYVLGMGLTDAAKPFTDQMASHGGTAKTDGTAYYADNPAGLTTALNAIFDDIINRSFSFSTASVSSSRLADENYLYEASFEPTSTDPFWKGYLKKWSLKSDGSLDSVLWEAGSVLQGTAASARNIYTLINGALTPFTTSNITHTHLNVADQTAANAVINYIKGESTANPDNWKLGDIYHSNPITIGSPSPYFADFLDETNAYAAFRASHPRASHCSDGGTSCDGYGKRLIVVGANDGQFHAFKGTTGQEFWSFIPPNFLPKLRYLAHSSHPLTSPVQEHMFFVDGPVTVADVWLGTGSGNPKSASDWRTLAVFSVGRNDRDYSTADKSAVPQSTKYWSFNDSSCGTLRESYTTPPSPITDLYTYCGYYAFNFTDVTDSSPTFMWTLNTSVDNQENVWPYFGEPWSRMNIGRVKIGGNEKWVGFIGGGYNADTAPGDKRGKGVFAVDLSNGSIMWSFTYADNNDLEYAVAAPLAIADTDNDGFIDAAYTGDIKGNMWQFHFCKKSDGDSCTISNWSGTLLLDKIGSSDKFPVYHQPTLAKDSDGNIWLYWGTGDKTDPNGNTPGQYIYGLKPEWCKNSSGVPTPCVRNDLVNITSIQNDYCRDQSAPGWFINLAGQWEKILAEPVAFGNLVYFTSFVPALGSSASCTKTGTSYLYAINILTGQGSCNAGSGAFEGGERRMAVGVGIASAPMISLKPGSTLPPDLYVTTSGAGNQESSTLRTNFNPPTLPNRTNMLYWKDKRIEVPN